MKDKILLCIAFGITISISLVFVSAFGYTMRDGPISPLYAKYQFGYNNFNGSGNWSGTAINVDHIAENDPGHNIEFDNNILMNFLNAKLTIFDVTNQNAKFQLGRKTNEMIQITSNDNDVIFNMIQDLDEGADHEFRFDMTGGQTISKAWYNWRFDSSIAMRLNNTGLFVEENITAEWILPNHLRAITYHSTGANLPFNFYDDGNNIILNMTSVEEEFNIETENTKLVLFNEPKISNDFKVMQIFSKEASDITEFVVTKAGEEHTSYFIRSLAIVGNATTTPTPFNCSTFANYIDCKTDVTGADLYVQDDLEVNGTIFGDGSQLTGIIDRFFNWTYGAGATDDFKTVGDGDFGGLLNLRQDADGANFGTGVPTTGIRVWGFDDKSDRYLNFGVDQNGLAVIGGNIGTIYFSPNNALVVFFNSGGIGVGGNIDMSFGGATLDNIRIRNNRFQTAGDTLMIGLNDDVAGSFQSRSMIITDVNDRAFNFQHPDQANPTLFIHSANQATDEWISFAHNQSDGFINVGKGNLILNPTFDVMIGDGTISKNITMFSPDGTRFTCGVNNTGSFICS